MKHIIPPRANMPTISNAAHRTLSTRPEYNNPASKLEIKPIIKQDYETLIKEYQAAKQEIFPRLAELKQIAIDANKVYVTAYNNYTQLYQEYSSLDYKEKTLIHEQKMATKVKKPSIKKSKSTEENSAKLAMKILAALPPEKQAEILALIKQQSS